MASRTAPAHDVGATGEDADSVPAVFGVKALQYMPPCRYGGHLVSRDAEARHSLAGSNLCGL